MDGEFCMVQHRCMLLLYVLIVNVSVVQIKGGWNIQGDFFYASLLVTEKVSHAWGVSVMFP